jgi:signal transduction histidine kinase
MGSSGADDNRELSAEDLLAIVDHELGNVATVIVALSHLLDRRWEETPDSERRQLVRRVAAQADALATLLTNLRVLRRGGAFGSGTDAEQLDTDPSGTLTSLVEDLQVATPSHVVLGQIPADLPPVPLDVSRLGQVLRNLVANAAKFAPGGSSIEIRAQRVGPWLELTVDDGGPGIAPADRQRVFDKFVQVDPNRPGAGLGLFISRAIVESAGGEISIGDSPAGGCRVCVRLPIPDVS